MAMKPMSFYRRESFKCIFHFELHGIPFFKRGYIRDMVYRPKYILMAILGIGLSLCANGITLEECYELARENYPLIRQYDLSRQLEQFSFSNAAKGYLPQIALTGQVTYQSEVAEFPDEMNAMFKSTGIDFKGLSRDQYKLLLQVTQTIWDGGASKAQKESITAETNISQLTIDKELDAIKSRINQLYFGTLLMELNLLTNRHIDTLLHENLRHAESGLKNGLFMQSDIDNITVEILSLEQQRVQLTATIDLYREMLSILTGSDITNGVILELPEIPKIDKNVNNRVELKLFDAQLEQLNINERVINSSIMPRFDLFAQGWYGRPGLNMFDDMINNNFSWNYLTGIRFQWNISGFYSRKNNLNSIKVKHNSIGIQKDIFLLNSSMELSQIENEIAKMTDLKATDDKIVSLRQSIRKSSESRYRNGIITATDLLRDITNENNAILTRSTHELDLLRNIYDFKITLNQ